MFDAVARMCEPAIAASLVAGVGTEELFMKRKILWVSVLLMAVLFASCGSDPEPAPVAPSRTVTTTKSAADQAESKAVEVHAPGVAPEEFQAGQDAYALAEDAEAAGNAEEAMDLYDQAMASFDSARQKAEQARDEAREALNQVNQGLRDSESRAQAR